MKITNIYLMSEWAYSQCLNGNDTEEIRSLIICSSWAYLYCYYIDNDPEVRRIFERKNEINR